MPLPKINYIDVGDHGTFRPSGDPANDTTPADLDSIFSFMQDNHQDKLLLYFHGGLVSEGPAMASAELIVNELVDKTDVHPVAFIWETGIGEILTQNLRTASSSDLFQSILAKILRVAGDKLNAQAADPGGTVMLSALDSGALGTELRKPKPLENFRVDRAQLFPLTDDQFLRDDIEMRLEAEIRKDPDFNSLLVDKLSPLQLSLMRKESLLNVPAAGAPAALSLAKFIPGAVQVVLNIIRRFHSGHDHDLFPTAVEEILRNGFLGKFGLDLWTEMKAKADEMWQEDAAGTTGNDQHAGRYLLRRICDYAANGPDLTIDLVGHSAGAVAICYFVREFLKLNTTAKIRDIVFMAPACRSDLFDSTVIAGGDFFRNFRMFTMKDENEKKDYCGSPLLYSHSLLYLISGLLEKDENDACILGLERYLKNEPPFDRDDMLHRVIAFMNAVPNRAVFSATAANALPGLRCTALHHGQFHDADPNPAMQDDFLTMGSIDYMLMND